MHCKLTESQIKNMMNFTHITLAACKKRESKLNECSSIENVFIYVNKMSDCVTSLKGCYIEDEEEQEFQAIIQDWEHNLNKVGKILCDKREFMPNILEWVTASFSDSDIQKRYKQTIYQIVILNEVMNEMKYESTNVHKTFLSAWQEFGEYAKKLVSKSSTNQNVQVENHQEFHKMCDRTQKRFMKSVNAYLEYTR